MAGQMVSEISLATPAARSHWLTIEWLSKYAAELNDIDFVWCGFKAHHHLACQTFTMPARSAEPFTPPSTSSTASEGPFRWPT